MDTKKFEAIIGLIEPFAKAHPEIRAVGLCGSWARGMASHDSDIDLTLITQNTARFKRTTWMDAVGFNAIHDPVDRWRDQVYGRVWSRHMLLFSGAKVEFSFADLSWTDTHPVDEGTVRVISDGYKVLYDPDGLLKRLVNSLR